MNEDRHNGESQQTADDAAVGESNGDHHANGDDAHDDPIVDLHPETTETELDVAPEVHIAESLNAALKHLRESADALEKITDPDERVAAAERLAEEAAELDEQIGSIARKDDG